MWSADYEASCRVNEELCVRIDHMGRENRIKHIALDILVNLLLGHLLIVLSGENYRI